MEATFCTTAYGRSRGLHTPLTTSVLCAYSLQFMPVAIRHDYLHHTVNIFEIYLLGFQRFTICY